ncbi:MAG: hypothetical protein JWQ71_3427 [Pedosphaera sp.]|nr:hypothetical protein [Pedosphaera sp.]
MNRQPRALCPGKPQWFFHLLLWMMLPMSVWGAINAKTLPQAAKWERFEQTFKSFTNYPNAFQDVTLSVAFTSPSGETTKVPGFWDGGKIWRARFSPNELGIWTFKSTCSDTTNSGMHNVIGEFLCIAASSKSRFDRHGPVQLASDRRHLEHEDHAPFFWLADTVWNGALLSSQPDWDSYAHTRASQKFTVAQWVAISGVNLNYQNAFTGRDQISISPRFFKQLDDKVKILNDAGLLSAIVPFWDLQSQGANAVESLPEDQAILLLRYMVARWGANDVIWMLACEGDSIGKKAGRWKRICRAVFGEAPHAPVMLHPGETYWVADEFRAEPWLDLLGYQSGQQINDDMLQWMLAGPFSNDWKKQPVHPFINLAPLYENATSGAFQQKVSPLAVRRALYWSLLNAPTAGVSYGAEGVWNWVAENEPKVSAAAARSAIPQTWQRNLFLPVAEQMTNLAGVFSSIDFWRLRPAPELVADQPGLKSPQRFIAAALTETKDVALIYVPEDRTIQLNLVGMPESLTAIWINVRTGERTPMVTFSGGQIRKFLMPDAGDWLMLIRAPQQPP